MIARSIPRAPSAELVVAEAVLRVGAVLTAVAAAFLLLVGGGILPGSGRIPGTGPGEMISERVLLQDAQAMPSITAVNQALGTATDGSTGSGGAPAEVTTSLSPGNGSVVVANSPTEVTVDFRNPSASQKWAWVLVRALPAACACAGLWLLAGLARSARHGDPFTRANVRRLTAITVLTGVAGVVGGWGGALVRIWLINSSAVGSVAIQELNLSFGFVGLLLVLAVVTEVWRRGVTMRDDPEGLV